MECQCQFSRHPFSAAMQDTYALCRSSHYIGLLRGSSSFHLQVPDTSRGRFYGWDDRKMLVLWPPKPCSKNWSFLWSYRHQSFWKWTLTVLLSWLPTVCGEKSRCFLQKFIKLFKLTVFLFELFDPLVCCLKLASFIACFLNSSSYCFPVPIDDTLLCFYYTLTVLYVSSFIIQD